MEEIEDVAIGPQAADNFGAGWGVDGLAQGTDRDHAVIAYTDAGLLAPDIGPPGTGRGGTEDGMVLSQGLIEGGLWGGAQFAMDFVLIGMEPELVEQAVGGFQVQDVISGQDRGQAFLPVVVAAFDFAFGVRRELRLMQVKQSFKACRVVFKSGILCAIKSGNL